MDFHYKKIKNVLVLGPIHQVSKWVYSMSVLINLLIKSVFVYAFIVLYWL